jgi:hypothetical protein
MHHLMSPDDGIDRAGTAAMGATDTQCFIDNCDGLDHVRVWCVCEWHKIPAQQCRESSNGIVAARRAKIDVSAPLDDRGRVRPATGEATLSTLRLGQQVVNLVDDVIGLRGKLSIGETEQ